MVHFRRIIAGRIKQIVMQTMRTEKTRINAITALYWLMLVCLSFAFAACQPDKTQAGTSLVYGLTLRPSGFDPHIHQSSELGIVFRQVYDTLVYRDPDTMEIVPGLAQSWEISDDRLTYTFILRQDVSFHDGTTFNARAVAANLDRILDQSDPQTISQRAQFMLGPLQRYDVVDDFTIRLQLSEPYTPLLDSLAQVYLGMASPQALLEYPRDTYQFHQVGTGPFKLAEFVPGSRIVLEPNPAYNWGPEFYQIDERSLPDQIIFRFFDDPPTRRPALESGDIDIIGELLPLDARTLIGNGVFRLQPVSVPGQPIQLFMNTGEYPTDNTTFRQALIYGTNRQAIVDSIFQGFASVAWGPITQPTLYFDRSLIGLYDYDPTMARSMLESIGFSDADGNGYMDDGDGDLEVVIVHASWSQLPDTVQLIRDQWRAIGVRAVIEPVAGFPALIARAREGNYNLISFDTSGLDPSLLNQFYLSTGANNFSQFQSADLDNLLIQASQELAPSIRRSLYAQIQTAIMNQALVLPIRERVNLNATNVRVNDLQFDAYGWFPLLYNISVTDDS